MINQTKLLIIIIFTIVASPVIYGQNIADYKNCEDSIIKEISVDENLNSEFFFTSESSYPWYIIPNDDGTFENVLGKEISKEDTILIEHTSNCLSTHQGEHVMHLCDAVMKSPDLLQLNIHGGLPAYASSLMIQIKDSRFKCYFKAVYPAPITGLKWKILSKELKVKAKDFKKGKRLYGWLSVVFEETGTYRGKTTKEKYKIEGYLKPKIE